MRLVTAAWAPSDSERREVSTPMSLPANAAWRSSRVFTARATSARNSAIRRPCTSGSDWGS
eukprot:4959082-Alexandrium_andersonii.AAC.1